MRLIDADEVANCYERMMNILDKKNALPEQITEYVVAREYLQWASYVINNTPTVDTVSREKYEASEEARHILVEFADDLLAELKEKVEVVRCKDCKYWELCDEEDGISYGQCMHPSCVISNTVFLNEDWYCADGERKKE